MKSVTLAHGSGGVESNKLIGDVFFSRLKNDILLSAEDAAVFRIEGKTAFTTDSFIVSPIFFAGGDIGKIAVCGSCNDLAVMGARPKYLSLSLIIEEGFSIDDLETIADSIARELEVNGAKVVTGANRQSAGKRKKSKKTFSSNGAPSIVQRAPASHHSPRISRPNDAGTNRSQ
jgi:hydrogenase expression/formation protein HypE